LMRQLWARRGIWQASHHPGRFSKLIWRKARG
jgi:hypothetical protein